MSEFVFAVKNGCIHTILPQEAGDYTWVFSSLDEAEDHLNNADRAIQDYQEDSFGTIAIHALIILASIMLAVGAVMGAFHALH